MSFFDKNMASLSQERRSQKVYQLLQQTNINPEAIELFETDHADYTLRYQNIFLHHVQGAQKEAGMICEKEGQLHPNVRANHIILGLGLGYLLDEVFQRSEGKIFIYEPNLAILRFTFENVDLSHYLNSRRIYIATNISEMLRQMTGRFIAGEPVDILVTQGYAALLANEIPDIMNHLISFVEEQRTNINVGLNFHLQWVEYFLKNIPLFPNTLPFDPLVGQYQNKPALIISSGPSLDKAIPAIKQHRNKCVLFAVGGALRPLLTAGIEPDFAVFLDFQGPKEQLALLPMSTQNIHFLCGPFVDPTCFTKEAKSHHLLSFHNYPMLADWLDQTLGDTRYRIRAGATVSMTAFENARAMGCNPLILVGQDLALTGGKYYAGGIDANITEDGTANLDNSETMVGRTIKLLEIQGQDGTMLQTTPDYFSYRKHLSELAHELKTEQPELVLFNASTGGALIPGFEHLPLDQILTRYQTEPILPIDIPNSDKHDADKIRTQLEEGVRLLLNHLKQAAIQANTALGHAQALTDSQQPSEAMETLYKQERQKFSEILNQIPFIEYCLRKEIWELQESFCFSPKTPDEIRHNWQTDIRYFQNSAKLLQQTIIPQVQHCLIALEPVVRVVREEQFPGTKSAGEEFTKQ